MEPTHLEKIHEAYKQGVMTTTRNLDEVIFVDPAPVLEILKENGLKTDGILSTTEIGENLEALREEIGAQAHDALLDKIETAVKDAINKDHPGAGDALFSHEKITPYTFLKGPGAIDNMVFNEKALGFAILPSAQEDTLGKYIYHNLEDAYSTQTLSRIYEHARPLLSDEELFNGIGQHEGAHLDASAIEKQTNTLPSEVAQAIDEYHADKISFKGSAPGYVLFKEHFRALNLGDIEHTISPLRDAPSHLSALDLATSQTFHRFAYGAVYENFDFSTHKTASDAEELLYHDPKAFADTLQKAISNEFEITKIAFEQDPTSKEKFESALIMQKIKSHADGYQNAVYELILGEPSPHPVSEKIISEEAEKAHLEKIGQKPFVSNTEVDLKNGTVMSGGKPIEECFAQAASPEATPAPEMPATALTTTAPEITQGTNINIL